MKVICAGMPKTGTKSLGAALQILGYNVYDFMENYEFLGEDWMKILTEGGSTEDFARIYQNIDAATDLPSSIFWEELSLAFPEAKIIFSTRENEDEWMKSAHKQNESYNSVQIKLLRCFSPTFLPLHNYMDQLAMAAYGYVPKYPLFGKRKINETLHKKAYRKHNAHVLKAAPKDRFLQYSVKEGWAPLCKFLEVDIPNIPFPHKNQNGEITAKYLKENRLLIRMKREVILAITLLVVLLAYFWYYICVKGYSYFS